MMGKQMQKLLLVAMLSVFVAACASSGSGDTSTTPSAQVVTSELHTDNPEYDTDDLIMDNKSTSAIAQNDPDEIVCRRERATGSNISRRVCRRRADIEARAADDQGALRQMRSTASEGTGAN